jgi:hypothetical protein
LPGIAESSSHWSFQPSKHLKPFGSRPPQCSGDARKKIGGVVVSVGACLTNMGKTFVQYVRQRVIMTATRRMPTNYLSVKALRRAKVTKW